MILLHWALIYNIFYIRKNVENVLDLENPLNDQLYSLIYYIVLSLFLFLNANLLLR